MTDRSRAHADAPRLLEGSAILCACAYAGLGLFAMLFLSPRAPYADSYRFLSTFLELPFPEDLLAADNGHREVVTNIVRLAELEWFGANQWLQTATGTILVVAFVVLLLRLLRGIPNRATASAALVVAVGVFWLGNGRKLAHGSEAAHLGIILTCLGAGLALLTHQERDGAVRRAWLGGMLGIVASLAFGSGLACFPAFAAVLFVQRAPARRWLPIAACGLLAALALMYGGGGTRAHVEFAPAFQFDIWLRWLGAPFIWALNPLLDPSHAARLPSALLSEPALFVAEPVHAWFGPTQAARWPAAAFGVLGLGWLVLVTARAFGGTDVGRHRLLAIGLGWFACTVGLLLVALRAGFFAELPGQIAARRYLPWSMLLWTGLGIDFVAAPHRTRRVAALAALGVALLLAPSQVWTGRTAARLQRTAEQTAVGCAVGVLDRDFELGETVPAELVHALPLLRAARAAMFAWPETTLLGTAPPPERILPVELSDVVIEPVDNLLGERGRRIRFACLAPTTRLLLLDDSGTVQGLAARAGLGDDWAGWLRGGATPSWPRAAALR